MERLSLESDWAALNVTLRDPAAWEAHDVPGRERLVVSLATVMKDMASTMMQLWGVTSMNKLIEKVHSATVMAGGVPALGSGLPVKMLSRSCQFGFAGDAPCDMRYSPDTGSSI
jgi:hypothetical protein